METSNLSLEEYISSPQGIGLDFVIGSERIALEFLKLTRRRSNLLFTKWWIFKKIGRLLIEDGRIRNFKLCLDMTLRSRAFMRDEGEIHISLGLLLSRSSWTMLPLYVHELSHMWLSGREDYGRIKELQRKFREKYAGSVYCERMSPIEVYADLLTIGILKELHSYASGISRNRILRMIIEREARLTLLLGELSKLRDAN